MALFSDIHGNLTGLKAVLAAIDAAGGADVLIAVGDLIGGESSADEVLDLLQQHGVQMVQGDSDTEAKLLDLEAEAEANPGSTRSPAWYYRAMHEWIAANLSATNRAFLDALPLSLTIDAASGQRLYVCHASPRSVGDRVCAPFCDAATVREAFSGVDAQIIAFGHAHESFVRVLDGRPLVNVASVGMRHDGLSHWTMLTCAESGRDAHWQIAQHGVPFDVAAEQAQCQKRGVPYYP